MLLIWKDKVWFPVCHPDLTEISACPLLLLCLWSLCGYLGSGLGKSGVVGHSMGITSVLCFPVETWRAPREPGDTAASWVTTEKRIKLNRDFFLSYRKFITGSYLVKWWFLKKNTQVLLCPFYFVSSGWYCWRGENALMFSQVGCVFFCGVSVVFNSDLILVDGIFISSAITVEVLKYSSKCVCCLETSLKWPYCGLWLFISPVVSLWC